MKPRSDDAIIARLLDDAVPASAKQWLASPAGQRRLRTYRNVLAALADAYGDDAVASRPRVYYATVRTPIGRVLVAATSAGLARLSFRRDESAVLRELRQRLHAEVVGSAERIAAITAQLDAYFAGERRQFDVPIDFGLTTPFQRRVLEATRAVPPGEVVSYADIGRRIGQPRASRAIGQALGRNPVPIVVPCHRVIASDGSLGGYTGGLPIKRKLLALEDPEWRK
jgi:methylated-DNA-[protein]-cysteine S-methyltransferase